MRIAMYEALADDLNPWWRDPHARRARAYPVRRHLQPRLLRQILNLGDRRAQVVEGPRQVGKTVMLRQLVDDLLDGGWPPGNLTYFDFSDERLTEKVFPRDIAALRPPSAVPGHPQVLLLDEVTSAPDWDRWLKRAVDESERGEGAGRLRIIATDSSSTLLRAGATESGLGRWDEHVVETLNLSEVLDLLAPQLGIDLESPEAAAGTLRLRPFLVEDYLRLGGYPEPWVWGGAEEARERLRRDLFDKAIAKDLVRLGFEFDRPRQLLAYLMEVSGAELNVAERAQSLEADQRTARAWLEALEGTRLLWLLPRFGRQAASRLGRQPRVYAADPGIVGAFAVDLTNEKIAGRRVEAAVFRHLRDASREIRGRLSFLRERSGELEADFVFESEVGGLRVVVECTASRQARPDKVAAVARAAEVAGATHGVLVHGGFEETTDGRGVHVTPLAEFLLDPTRYLRGERT
jgi:uncharacterized protein